MQAIEGYHAHVYFDADTAEKAEKICRTVSEKFEIVMGRMHHRPVGPHPMWSCQLSVPPEKFSQVVPWLSLNRAGLVVFIHPETGDVLADHTDHAMWMGQMMELDLSVFN